jgi:glycosyltransferase involved in cell wall biosynthesis
MEDTVTALITTYKRPKFLCQAVLSVLQQEHKNIQVSIFDDASNDDTAAVVNKLISEDARVHYHCNETNLGQMRNIALAFSKVQTPYFSFLSDDEFITKGLYSKSIAILEKNPDIMFVLSNTLSIDKDCKLVGCSNNTNGIKFYRGVKRLEDAIHDEVPITMTSIVYRREVAQVYLNMDHRFDIGNDIRFIRYAMAKYNFVYTSTVGGFFIEHNESFSASKKYFNLSHVAVQASRYAEIYYDADIDRYIRDSMLGHIQKLLYPSIWSKTRELKKIFLRTVKLICEEEEFSDKKVQKDIHDAKNSGYNASATLLKAMYHSIFSRRVIKFFFTKYLQHRRKNQAASMLYLMETNYKFIFKNIELLKKDSIKRYNLKN